MKNRMLDFNIWLRHIIIISILVNVFMGCISDIPSTKTKTVFEYFPSKDIKTTDTIRFTNNSRNADVFYWDFGDGSGSYDREPKHVFKNKGVYLVKLIASKMYVSDNNFEQDVDTLTKLIDVSIGVPKSRFGYKRTSILTITLIDSSTSVTDYLWDFGDGTTSIEKNPIHTYNTYGSYCVSLKATNDGLTDMVTTTIVVSDVVSLNNQFITWEWSGTPVDVDIDGIADFTTYWYNHTGPSGSSSSARITPFNNYEIYTDTTSQRSWKFVNGTKQEVIKIGAIPKIFLFGDIVQNSTMTTKTWISFYETYGSWSNNEYFRSIEWQKNEIRYVCFRKVVDNKTKIGWIKLNLSTLNLFSFKIPSETESLLIDK